MGEREKGGKRSSHLLRRGRRVDVGIEWGRERKERKKKLLMEGGGGGGRGGRGGGGRGGGGARGGGGGGRKQGRKMISFVAPLFSAPEGTGQRQGQKCTLKKSLRLKMVKTGRRQWATRTRKVCSMTATLRRVFRREEEEDCFYCSSAVEEDRLVVPRLTSTER